MRERPELDARTKAWQDFLMRYYYEHQNHHMKGNIDDTIEEIGDRNG